MIAQPPPNRGASADAVTDNVSNPTAYIRFRTTEMANTQTDNGWTAFVYSLSSNPWNHHLWTDARDLGGGGGGGGGS